jgi:hypothetical protein
MTQHEKLLNNLLLHGWEKKQFKRNLIKKLKQKPWRQGDRYLINKAFKFNCLPDCYRFKIEHWGPNIPCIGHYILVVECMEIVVNNELTKNKLELYNDLWWAFDNSDNQHLRVYRMNKDSTISTILDEMPLEIEEIYKTKPEHAINVCRESGMNIDKYMARHKKINELCQF